MDLSDDVFLDETKKHISQSQPLQTGSNTFYIR